MQVPILEAQRSSYRLTMQWGSGRVVWDHWWDVEKETWKQKELERKKLKTENKPAVWSGNRIGDNGICMDADGKLMAHCAEKSQEGPV